MGFAVQGARGLQRMTPREPGAAGALGGCGAGRRRTCIYVSLAQWQNGYNASGVRIYIRKNISSLPAAVLARCALVSWVRAAPGLLRPSALLRLSRSRVLPAHAHGAADGGFHFHALNCTEPYSWTIFLPTTFPVAARHALFPPSHPALACILPSLPLPSPPFRPVHTLQTPQPSLARPPPLTTASCRCPRRC